MLAILSIWACSEEATGQICQIKVRSVTVSWRSGKRRGGTIDSLRSSESHADFVQTEMTPLHLLNLADIEAEESIHLPEASVLIQGFGSWIPVSPLHIDTDGDMRSKQVHLRVPYFFKIFSTPLGFKNHSLDTCPLEGHHSQIFHYQKISQD